MGSKGHLIISLIKSVIRMIAAGFLLPTPYWIVGAGFIIAEVLGILEELVDKR